VKIIRGIEQGTDEWLKIRLGKITASRIKDVMSKGRGDRPSKTRSSYMEQLIKERITGCQQKTISNVYMEWGNEQEPNARAMYEFINNIDVELVTFVEHNDYFGVSPDGFVGDDGLLEIKCPETTTQIQRVLDYVFPVRYKPQVQAQLYVCQRKWCDFVSYDPRLNGDASYFEKRVHIDMDYINNELLPAVEDFKTEMFEKLEKLGIKND